LYHPGRSESLDISGTLSGQSSGTLSGTITFIVTKETSHGRPVNVMNTTVVLRNAEGERKQFEHQEVYEVRRDGRLKLLYKSEGSTQVWVNSSTCAGEPRDYIDGHSDGCETHFEDGSVQRSTSAVAVDGDYLKVTTITKTTDKSGDRDSTETLWLDPSTGHYVRFSGAISGSDGNQLTLTGR
jgi:hypothetical protein